MKFFCMGPLTSQIITEILMEILMTSLELGSNLNGKEFEINWHKIDFIVCKL